MIGPPGKLIICVYLAPQYLIACYLPAKTHITEIIDSVNKVQWLTNPLSLSSPFSVHSVKAFSCNRKNLQTRAQKTVEVKNNRIIFAVLLVPHVCHILQMTFMISILYSPVKAGSLTLYFLWVVCKLFWQ